MGELWFFERSLKYLGRDTNKHLLSSVGIRWDRCGAMKGVKNLSEET
jgi:hypothetical protein